MNINEDYELHTTMYPVSDHFQSLRQPIPRGPLTVPGHQRWARLWSSYMIICAVCVRIELQRGIHSTRTAPCNGLQCVKLQWAKLQWAYLQCESLQWAKSQCTKLQWAEFTKRKLQWESYNEKVTLRLESEVCKSLHQTLIEKDWKDWIFKCTAFECKPWQTLKSSSWRNFLPRLPPK